MATKSSSETLQEYEIEGLLGKRRYVDEAGRFQQLSSKQPYRRQKVHLVLAHAVNVILVFIILLLAVPSRKCSDPSQVVYSPAQDAIEYQVKVFSENFASKGPYMGSEEDGVPTDKTDALWEDLFQFGTSHINAAAAAKLPNKTTEVPGMTGRFPIQMDVFHQLHCLNVIRQTLYPERYRDKFGDYYLSDGTRNYTSWTAHHFDHCIDSMRQSLMCHSDISTVYWQWTSEKRRPAPRLAVTHTCRNFDAIKRWAKEHQLKDDEKVLQWTPGPEIDFVLSGS